MRSLRFLSLALLVVGSAASGCGCRALKLDAPPLAYSDSWPIAPDSTNEPLVPITTAPLEHSRRPGWLRPHARANYDKQQQLALPAGAPLQLPKKLRNSTIIFQTGTGHVANPKTDIGTKEKLSGGSSSARDSGLASASSKSTGVAVGTGAVAAPVVEQRSSSVPWWLLVVGLLVGLLSGSWLGVRFSSALRWLPFLSLLLLVGAPVQAQKQLQISSSRFNYTEARRIEKANEKAKQKNRTLRRRENRHSYKEYMAGQRELRRNRKHRKPVSLVYPMPF